MCKTIKQKVKFKAPPEAIYQLLADSKKHALVTGEKAAISGKIGGSFTALSDQITGINVDLSPGKRIVQAWRSNEFPVGIFSMVTLNLNETKDGGTELILTHRGVPKDLIPQVEEGWRKYYWNKIRHYLGNQDWKLTSKNPVSA